MVNEADNKLTWVIKDFSSLQSQRIYSDGFLIGGYKWCKSNLFSNVIFSACKICLGAKSFILTLGVLLLIQREPKLISCLCILE